MDKGELEFFTMKGYVEHTHGLSASMEDYLEMIYRLSINGKIIRISELASNLHVRPPSASKMAYLLKNSGFILFQKYGYISLTEKGKNTGEYLLYRHETIHRFLCLLNQSDNELEQTEKIEHYINAKTVQNLAHLNDVLNVKKESQNN